MVTLYVFIISARYRNSTGSKQHISFIKKKKKNDKRTTASERLLPCRATKEMKMEGNMHVETLKKHARHEGAGKK